MNVVLSLVNESTMIGLRIGHDLQWADTPEKIRGYSELGVPTLGH